MDMYIVLYGSDSTGDKTKRNKIIQVVAQEQLLAQAVRATNNGMGLLRDVLYRTHPTVEVHRVISELLA